MIYNKYDISSYSKYIRIYSTSKYGKISTKIKINTKFDGKYFKYGMYDNLILRIRCDSFN